MLLDNTATKSKQLSHFFFLQQIPSLVVEKQKNVYHSQSQHYRLSNPVKHYHSTIGADILWTFCEITIRK